MSLKFLSEENYQNFIAAGIDEAGRGPLAGVVVAACVILDKKNIPDGIQDSKKISKKNRSKIFQEIKKTAYFGVGIVDEKIIDKINILQATKLAMQKAYLDLSSKYEIFPQIILVDGNFAPFSQDIDKTNNLLEITPVIRGDSKDLNIAAASIIAKETRDEIMLELHKEFPQYGWNKNSGYPTKFHLEQIQKFGICKYHRKTFRGCK